MKKVSLPAPPLPDFFEASTRTQNLSHDRPASKLAPLDAAFLRRTCYTTIWFGALLSLCVYGATRSILVATSFATGAVLSVLLLKSQEMFVQRLARSKSNSPDVIEYSNPLFRLPLWVLLPLKYLLVALLIAMGLRYRILVPAAFAAGFTTLQIVIFARVLGRLMAHRMRSVREVYVSAKD